MLDVSFSCSQAHRGGDASVGRTKVYPPGIPKHPWTDGEISEAEGLLKDAVWPTFNDIYSHVKGGAHTLIVAEVLVAKARVLQLALLLAMQEGRFQRLAQNLEKGQKGMETVVLADFHEDGCLAEYYEKTAGDMVQSYWCRKNLTDMSDCFQYNPTQAAIARWLQLPDLLLPQCLADRVMAWAEHPLADFQEQVTLYLPSRLVQLYLSVCTSYHVHFVKGDGEAKLCQHRNHRGLLCCDAQARKNYGRFCSYKHCSDERCRVLATFDAAAYGAEYLAIQKGDMVLFEHHLEAGDGWSYVLLLRTLERGWIPTEFAEPQ